MISSLTLHEPRAFPQLCSSAFLRPLPPETATQPGSSSTAVDAAAYFKSTILSCLSPSTCLAVATAACLHHYPSFFPAKAS